MPKRIRDRRGRVGRAKVTTIGEARKEVAAKLASFYSDPLGYVRWNWPGTEPYDWQRKIMEDMKEHIERQKFDGKQAVKPFMQAVVSGHGVGKSAFMAWMNMFFIDTRPWSKGSVTATTYGQLQSKTWAEQNYWHSRAITKHLTTITNGSKLTLRHSGGSGLAWGSVASRPTDPDSFQGQHTATSTSFGLFDESSGIDPELFESFGGAMTRGEPFWFAFGNGTKASGEFWKIFHDKSKWYDPETGEGWRRMHVNVMDMPDDQVGKFRANQIIREYGADSDMARVRVYGQFPILADLQFIDTDSVTRGESIESYHEASEPLVMGVDVARFGPDSSVIYLRRGSNARDPRDENGAIIPFPIRTWGKLRTTELARCMAELDERYDIKYIYFEEHGMGQSFDDILAEKSWRATVVPVNLQQAVNDGRYANMKTLLLGRLKERLEKGRLAIPKELPSDIDKPKDLGTVYDGGTTRLRDELVSFEAAPIIAAGGVKIAPSEQGSSPDVAMALALTFRHDYGHAAKTAVSGFEGVPGELWSPRRGPRTALDGFPANVVKYPPRIRR